MLVKAAINGGRSKDEHTAVPVSPDELAADAFACLKAGANAVHLHVRSTAGIESLDPEDLERTLLVVQPVCPLEQIGVSTGAWIVPDTAQRLETVSAWEVFPGFASVNFSEDGATELARLLLSRGVDVEAGLIDADSAEAFLKSGLVNRCIRVLFEPQEREIDSALETVNAIENVLDAEAPTQTLPRVLHGTEATAWPLMEEAINRGYGVRIGFEDTLVLPDGTLARDNAELVMEAFKRTQEAGAVGNRQ
jgi:uncharacterized protein (DUF849 family)